MSRQYESVTVEDVARFPLPGTVAPAALRFTPDGRALTFLYSAEGSLVRSLWRLDLATGGRTVLAGPSPESRDEGALSREEELRRERARLRELGVTAYEFASKAPGPVLLVPGGGRLSVSVGGGPLRELEGCDGAIDPHLSNDGRHVAFVRGGELWVAAVEGGPPRRLTHGAEEGLTHGLAEFIAQEELDRSRGFWWSPDGTRIAFERADERRIPPYPIVHQGLDRVEVEPHRYPFAGHPNAIVHLGVVSVEGGEPQWMGLGPDEDIYLARVQWRPDGALTAEMLSRDQKELRLVVFGADGASRVLIHERSEPWLNLSGDTRFLESGDVLWSSERTGFRHLYLHDAEGRELRPLTSGEWVVTRLMQVDEAERQVYFAGTKDGVTERHLYRVSLDGGEVERLTTDPGWHDPVVASRGGAWADVHSTRTSAPTVTLHLPGEQTTVVHDNGGMSAESLGLIVPELVTIPAADGTPLMAALYRPRASGDGRLPVVVSVYGGPHAQRCFDGWGLTVDLRAQYLAQHGFLVLKADTRGSANRGLAFEAPLYRNFGSVEVEDQAAAVEWLAANDRADLARAGIYGWSYGGYMTLMCMARRPDLFRVGVAGAPVTHWDGYDTGYTERYMSTPEKNPEGYRESAVMTHVDRLEGKLLLVHGMIDENVHFRHTARLAVALAAAQKPYDLLAFPEERHMPRDAKGLEYQERRVLGFFEEWL
ncbi:MAG: S9 family peptidase [Gemmataceae bacterium]|nr:S9 family peptidase [Gemmataceae bacterium]